MPARGGFTYRWEAFDRDHEHLFPVLTVEDLERVGAGSRIGVVLGLQNGKPVGSDPSRVELLWRLDGIDIPNPNHFATQGATGGPWSAS